MNDYLSNLVKCFNNSNLGVNLTTILIDNEPWFIAKEVATLLGYENTEKTIRTHVDEEDQKMLSCNECKELFGSILEIEVETDEVSDQDIVDTETVGSDENLKPTKTVGLKNSISISNFGMKLINESGLYTLITRSKKKEAKPFRRWVTSEVLPSIRKTGSYGLQLTEHETLLFNILKAKSEEEKTLAIKKLDEYHEREMKALEDKTKELEDERDKANKTKFQAMGKAGGLAKQNGILKDKLYGSRNRRTINAVATTNHLKERDINYHKLIKYCKNNGLEIIKVPDERWGEANSYPIEAFKAVYPELIID